MLYASFFFLSCLHLNSFGQNRGCCDPLALNFQTSVALPDGSCQYAATSIQPTVKFTNLPASLAEMSGLLLIDNFLYSINDGGNQNLIQKIDTSSGQIILQIPVIGMANNDWEALAMDDQFVYIGDFGNNDGTRTNLRVIRILKSALIAATASGVQGDVIQFSYPDQRSFVSSTSHNFDCEAFIADGDSLQLFSKNRSNFFTKHYSLAKIPGQHVARLKDSLFIGGQVTDAAKHPYRNEIAFVGYVINSTAAFTYLLFGFPGSDYFKINKRRLNLPAFATSGQVEGICYTPEGRWFISNERVSSIIPAKIISFNPGAFLNPFFTLTSSKQDFLKKENLSYTIRNGTIAVRSSEPLVQITIKDLAGRKIHSVPASGKESIIYYPGNIIGILLLEVSTLQGVFNQRICLE